MPPNVSSAKQETQQNQIGVQTSGSGTVTTTGAVTGKGALGPGASKVADKISVGKGASVNITSSDVLALQANENIAHDAIGKFQSVLHDALEANQTAVANAIASNEYTTRAALTASSNAAIPAPQPTMIVTSPSDGGAGSSQPIIIGSTGATFDINYRKIFIGAAALVGIGFAFYLITHNK